MALAETRKLVLVAGAQSQLFEINNREVKLLFMGLPIIKQDERLEPLLNASNEVLYEVFLQKIIYMSAKNYERRLLTKMFRFGGRRPVKYFNLDELLKNLKLSPRAVSFMWEVEARKLVNVKIVRELWSGRYD